MKTRADQVMWDRLFQLSSGRGKCLQAQLREQLAGAILDGHIPVEQPLPSSRELARQLGVARNTVMLAYQHLLDEGYLVSHERVGYFVNDAVLAGRVERAPAAEAAPGTQPDWDLHLRHRPSRQRNIEKPADWQRYRYPFIYGQLDPALFPVADWRECCRRALSVADIRSAAVDRIDHDDPDLVEQIQTRVLPRRGVWASRDEILVTLGAQQALFLLASLLLDRTCTLGMEEPGYVDARNIFSLRTRRLVPLAVDAQGLVPDARLDACDCVYVTPSHQSPTTVTLSMERRRELLARAADADFLVIEDDYESEVNYVAEPAPALKSLDAGGRVMYVGSLSKTLAPGLRVGYLVAPRELVEEARALRRLMVRHPPANNQHVVALFLGMGHHDSLIHRLSHAYRQRWRVMGETLERYLPSASRAPTSGGTAFWVAGPPWLDARVLARVAAERSILIEPGDVYFMAEDPPRNFFRLGFTSMPVDRIEPGIRALAAIIGELTP